ncbi:MAG: molybdenum cofactor biosynthesis protein MoaE [Anaerolineales bacterium]|nr:molybdenum cofactor biosynthesis protein MoaE [Anaerolineales bacterium]
MPLTVTVLFFANLKALAGVDQASLELEEGLDVKGLKAELGRRFPRMAPHLNSVLVAIDREYAFDEDRLSNGAEVALFPPVSGGEREFPTILRITQEALDLNDLLASITLPSTGAACVFTGMVRGVTRRGEARQTDYLEYEAYQPMAEEKMRQIAQEIRSRWPEVEGIVMVQRIGQLFPGTPTVAIACTAAHRDTGVFEAARYGIDRLKQIVPVWKKEVGPGHSVWVEGDYHPQPEN